MFRHIALTFFFLCFCLSANVSAALKNTPPMPAHTPALVEGNGGLTIEGFLALTPKKIKEQTGKRLTWKQIFLLKKAQKKVRKQLQAPLSTMGAKSQATALLLAIFLGFVGAHRFYLGYTLSGVFQLLTFGGCGIWAIMDIILIATGNLQPKYSPYDESLD